MIEPLKESEIQRIWLLASQLGYTVTEEKFHENIIELKKQESMIFVSKNGDEVTGFIAARINVGIVEGKFGEIIALVVSKRYRRKGLGSTLVAAAENWLMKQAKTIRVRSNVQRNEAHKFYKVLGYNHSKDQSLYTKSYDNV